MSEGHIRVRRWEEFKRLVREKKPKSIVYILEQNALSPNKELTTLRIILMHDKRYYIFRISQKVSVLEKRGFLCEKAKMVFITSTKMKSDDSTERV